MSEMFLNALGASSLVIAVLLTLIALVLFVYMTVLRQRKQHEFKELHKELAVGQRVSVMGVIFGEIVALRTDTCDIKVKSGAVLEVSRYAIQSIDSQTLGK